MANTQSDSFASNMISIYLFILFLFVLFKCVIFINTENPIININNFNFVLLFFSFIFFIYLFAFNLKLTKNKLICGSTNMNVAFTETIFPYIFIYGIGMLVIYILPGWKRSFSNTFGLTICRMSGYNLKEYFNPEMSDENSDNQSLNEIYLSIYNNPDIFINEIDFFDGSNTEDAFKKQVPSVLIKQINNTQAFYNVLKKYIVLKETIGTYIWVALLGILTILTSQNTLLNENCNKPIVKNDEFQKYVSNQLKN